MRRDDGRGFTSREKAWVLVGLVLSPRILTDPDGILDDEPEANVAGPWSELESIVVIEVVSDGACKPGGASISSSESVRSLSPSDSNPEVFWA